MVLRSFFFAFALCAMLFGCGDIERDNPYDEKSSRYDASLRKSSSSGAASRFEYCLIDGACHEVMSSDATDCYSYGGIPVASCSASSSSQAQATQSSSSYASSPSIASSSSRAAVVSGGSFTDPRDGQTYGYVHIGGQVWMSENLNYNASENYRGQYGRRYDWNIAMSACPSGWHLPSKAEWDALASYIESDKNCYNCAAEHLKSMSGWLYNGNGLDSYGFAALPGGHGGSDGTSFDFSGARWWSATEDDASYAYGWIISYVDEDAIWDSYDKAYYFFSIRCVQD